MDNLGYQQQQQLEQRRLRHGVLHRWHNVTFNDTTTPAAPMPTTRDAQHHVSPGSVIVNNSTGNYTISGTGTIGGTGSLTKSGTGTLTLSTANTYSGGTIVTAGSSSLSRPVATTSALADRRVVHQRHGIVQLADNVTAGIPPWRTSNVNLTSLSITGNGTLDIGNNRIIIDYGSPATDPIASIASGSTTATTACPVRRSSAATSQPTTPPAVSVMASVTPTAPMARSPACLRARSKSCSPCWATPTLTERSTAKTSRRSRPTRPARHLGSGGFQLRWNGQRRRLHALLAQSQPVRLAGRRGGRFGSGNGISLANVPEPGSRWSP